MADMAQNEKGGTVPCPVCPRHCAPAEGQPGFCRARAAKNGRVQSISYGRVASLALDPIEKKPLYHFHPGKTVFSVGGFGCNMRCWFCQNHEISQSGGEEGRLMALSPEELVAKAEELVPFGNIGLAFTYNEPAVGFEYVRDASRLAKERGMQSVMVTNGFFCPEILKVLLESVDAFNIDLKCFTEAGYQRLGGSLGAVKGTIAAAAKRAHVEVTSLVVPGFSDSEADMERQAAWLAGISPEIPLHLSRYFPRWQAEEPATPVNTLRRLGEVAKRHLAHVHLGNC